jgi:hypothetical protein
LDEVCQPSDIADNDVAGGMFGSVEDGIGD